MPSSRAVTATYSAIPHVVTIAQIHAASRFSAPTETTHFILATHAPDAGAGAIPGYQFTITDPENTLTCVFLTHMIREHVGSSDITPHLTIKRSKTYTEEPGPADFHIFVPESIFTADGTLKQFCWELMSALPHSLLA